MIDSELLVHSLRKLSISLQDLDVGNLKVNVLHGVVASPTYSDASSATDGGTLSRLSLGQADTEKDSSSRKTPSFPLPEHIIQLIIDVFEQQRAVSLAACAEEDARFTHKAVEHAYCFDHDLRSLALVSRQWTQPARHALGRRLVLVMGARRHQALMRALESPLFGPWTAHVEIIEMPYAPACDKEFVESSWNIAERVVGRLENVKSFKVNSRIVSSSSGLLSGMLAKLKSLEEFTLINTGSMLKTRPITACFSVQLPMLRKMNFRRYLPISNDLNSSEVRRSQYATQFLHVSRALQPLFTPYRCCFLGDEVSFVLDKDRKEWGVDELQLTKSYSLCSQGQACEYGDPLCVNVRSLRLAIEADSNPVCVAKLLYSVGENIKSLHLTLGLLPTRDLFESLSKSLEHVTIELTSEPSLSDFAMLDKQLLRFVDTRRTSLRTLTISTSRGKEGDRAHCQKFLPSTQVLCSELAVHFDATCDATRMAWY